MNDGKDENNMEETSEQISVTVSVKLTRTLWFNTYRGLVLDAAGDYFGTIRIIPEIPLARSEVPDNAPEVKSYVIILVEDAVSLTNDTIIEFETAVSQALLAELTKLNLTPEYCQFFYPHLTETLDSDMTMPQ